MLSILATSARLKRSSRDLRLNSFAQRVIMTALASVIANSNTANKKSARREKLWLTMLLVWLTKTMSFQKSSLTSFIKMRFSESNWTDVAVSRVLKRRIKLNLLPLTLVCKRPEISPQTNVLPCLQSDTVPQWLTATNQWWLTTSCTTLQASTVRQWDTALQCVSPHASTEKLCVCISDMFLSSQHNNKTV